MYNSELLCLSYSCTKCTKRTKCTKLTDYISLRKLRKLELLTGCILRLVGWLLVEIDGGLALIVKPCMDVYDTVSIVLSYWLDTASVESCWRMTIHCCLLLLLKALFIIYYYYYCVPTCKWMNAWCVFPFGPY